MSYAYNSRPLTLRDRIGAFLKGAAEAPQAAISEYYLPTVRWSPRFARNYFREGYKLNSAVFACTRAIANGFAEAPMKVYVDDSKEQEIPDHPLQKLIRRPNPLMGEDEWWKYCMTYAPTGGNAYGQIVPNNGGEPCQLWPYNDMVMWPVPVAKRWIDHYDYSVDNGVTVEHIPTEEIIHFKWAIDPDAPWRGMAALAPVAREVDTDNELTRYLMALLQNDAVPRTIVTRPPGIDRTPEQKMRDEAEWEQKFGGHNRGRAVFLAPGADVKRLSLDMQELALDALRGVPEARIAASYGVPAIVAGLNIGLARSTYSNFEEARKMFTETTLVPLWNAVASEMNQSLAPLFKRPCYVDFDLSQVRALSENTNTVAQWVVNAWDKGLLTRGMALSRLGEPAPTDGTQDDYKAPGPAPVPVSMDGMKSNNGHVKELVA